MAGYNPHLPEVTGAPLQPYRHCRWIARFPLLARSCAGGVLAVLLGVGAVQAQQSPRDAEKKLQQLRGELKNVAQERRQLEGDRDEASRRLR